MKTKSLNKKCWDVNHDAARICKEDPEAYRIFKKIYHGQVICAMYFLFYMFLLIFLSVFIIYLGFQLSNMNSENGNTILIVFLFAAILWCVLMLNLLYDVMFNYSSFGLGQSLAKKCFGLTLQEFDYISAFLNRIFDEYRPILGYGYGCKNRIYFVYQGEETSKYIADYPDDVKKAIWETNSILVHYEFRLNKTDYRQLETKFGYPLKLLREDIYIL